MHNSIRIWLLLILASVSVLLPSFILALAVIIPLSIVAPFFGIAFGFLLDCIFGAPSWLPPMIAYPFTIGAFVVALCATLLVRYLR